MDGRPFFVMTDPGCFNVSYRINPWMDPDTWTPEQAAQACAGSAALRKALSPHLSWLDSVDLADYKVRILQGHPGTDAVTRVLVESTDGERELRARAETRVRRYGFVDIDVER